MSKQSKFLSLILRHQPDAIGLQLDAQGWASVDELLSKLDTAGRGMSRQELQVLVDTSEKKRFTLSDDGVRIRAAQGHSIAVDLSLVPADPPQVLFHGTAIKNLASIDAQGLVSGRRQHVHLSADVETAIKVGQRHGKPVVLRVDCAAMRTDGFQFFRADNGVWLTDAVPARYLSQQA